MILENGMRVRDVISFREGIVTGIVKYISGCNQALIQPQMTDTKAQESFWCDLDRLEVIDAHPIILPRHDHPGADRETTRR